ncbi:hypothetical protein GCM10029976_006800 [Kribbella albertanoniae]
MVVGPNSMVISAREIAVIRIGDPPAPAGTAIRSPVRTLTRQCPSRHDFRFRPSSGSGTNSGVDGATGVGVGFGLGVGVGVGVELTDGVGVTLGGGDATSAGDEHPATSTTTSPTTQRFIPAT